jgi:hypothetical protein
MSKLTAAQQLIQDMITARKAGKAMSEDEYLLRIRKINEQDASTDESGADDGGGQTVDTDYMDLIRVYHQENPKKSAYDCIKAINKICPRAREDFIHKQQAAAGKKAESNDPTYSEAEVSGYLDTVKRYMIEKKVNRLQAVKEIDVLYPGLRMAFVEHSNKK